MDKWAVVGVAVGFLFGFNGIAMIFDMLGKVISDIKVHLTQVSTLLLLGFVVFLVWKAKVLTSLLVGAIIGAVLNFVLKMNGIDVVNIFWSEVLKTI
ncbi:hypothetical protein [Archaeoglobus sp.]